MILADVTVGCQSNGRCVSSISDLLAPAAKSSAGGTACSLLPWPAVLPRRPHRPLLLPLLARPSLCSPTSLHYCGFVQRPGCKKVNTAAYVHTGGVSNAYSRVRTAMARVHVWVGTQKQRRRRVHGEPTGWVGTECIVVFIGRAWTE